jgi:hypothetical protein
MKAKLEKPILNRLNKTHRTKKSNRKVLNWCNEELRATGSFLISEDLVFNDPCGSSIRGAMKSSENINLVGSNLLCIRNF